MITRQKIYPTAAIPDIFRVAAKRHVSAKAVRNRFEQCLRWPIGWASGMRFINPDELTQESDSGERAQPT